MSRVIVIGGSGHIGSYLIPRLVELGHVVVNVSRGQAKPYTPHYAWEHVETVTLDRLAEERAGAFAGKIAALGGNVVIDMIGFELGQVQPLVEALRGRIEQYIFCSTIWVYGRLRTVPSTEDEPPCPIDAYGRGKAEIESYLMREARRSGFPATVFRPGHIVGEGWDPITPMGNFDRAVWGQLARGEEIVLPNLGLETLHHVHADDLAQWIVCAMGNRAAAHGEIFNTVSEQAVTLRGYAEVAYEWFGQHPRIRYEPFEQWITRWKDEALRENTRGHIVRSSCHSIAKAKQRLGYAPRYSSLAAIYEGLRPLLFAGGSLAPRQ